jgi:hypothetical protein
MNIAYWLYNGLRFKNHLVILIIGSINFCILTGCSKLIEINGPETDISSADVFNSDATAIAVLTGIYTNLGTPFASGSGSVSLCAGLSADEFALYPTASNISRILYYSNSLSTTTLPDPDFWSRLYPFVFNANVAIEGLMNSSKLTPSIKQQLAGEAKFMRAFFYFYLVNFYGDVPLVISSDYTVNAVLPRAPKEQVWKQIINDLKEAEDLLSENYLDGSLLNVTVEKVRPTKASAASLLARAYLYTGDWENAELQSSFVINNNSSYDTVSLNNVFLRNSQEAIWQLQPIVAGRNTWDALLFILPESGPDDFDYSVYLSNSLINDFEIGDQRKSKWIGSVKAAGQKYYYPYKYKINLSPSSVIEYTTILRLAEQYLIRAEARIKLGNTMEGIDDLNIIRKRAGLPNYSSSTDRESLLKAVIHERRVELFSEWGHRWFDLKRTGLINEVMGLATLQKGSVWKTTQQLYPIPTSDIKRNRKLLQNSGY